MVALTLTHEHGYVLAAIVWSVILHHMWMPTLVMKARKTYNVPYPNLYAPAGHKNAKEFDCVQRAHQNSLENQPAFLIILLVAGLKYPVTAAIAGAVYLLGRIVYALGYSSGNPNGRQRGAFLHLGFLTLLGMVVRWAVELLLPLVKQA